MKNSPPPPCPGCDTLRQRLDEANRLMNAYRVKAHALSSELDAERERLSKSRASHKKIIADLQAALNEMHIRAVDAEAGFPCLAERDATIAALRKELSTLRSHLRHRLYAVNDGFIIPCLLDMSAAWERMAEAMHVAPVDSDKMAARCEELASIVSTIASRGNLEVER